MAEQTQVGYGDCAEEAGARCADADICNTAGGERYATAPASRAAA